MLIVLRSKLFSFFVYAYQFPSSAKLCSCMPLQDELENRQDAADAELVADMLNGAYAEPDLGGDGDVDVAAEGVDGDMSDAIRDDYEPNAYGVDGDGEVDQEEVFSDERPEEVVADEYQEEAFTDEQPEEEEVLPEEEPVEEFPL